MWIYHNNDYAISIHGQVKRIKNLVDEYGLSNKGWNLMPLAHIFKALQYETFDNVIAIVFSPKLRKNVYSNAVYEVLVEISNKKFIVECKCKPNEFKIIVYAKYGDIDTWGSSLGQKNCLKNIVMLTILKIYLNKEI